MVRPLVRLTCLVIVCAPALAAAQSPTVPPPPGALTLEAALQYAVDHYPSVQAALEQINASSAAVSVAKTAYLPRLDAVWQSNLASTNNVFGQLLPQSVIPALSGPVLPTASGQGVWSSATGALAAWEPFDFGLREAAVAAAETAVTRARAGETLTRLEVEATVGSAFLALASLQQTARALQADNDRRDVLDRAVHALVDNQLRAGADASRADAERAAAQTRLIQAQQAVDVATTTLSRVLGLAPSAVTIDVGVILDRLPPDTANVAPAAAHPLVQLRQLDVDLARAQERTLARTDLPRVYVQSSLFARGSGASPDGTLTSSPEGLQLDRVNWAAGVQVTFPNLFDFSALRARKAEAAASTRADLATYQETMLTIDAQRQTAAATLRASRAVAANTPVQLAAARQSETQARARYDAGLATLSELADAQSLLAQAEVQDQVARIDVWRAALALAVSNGSVAPFITLLHP